MKHYKGAFSFLITDCLRELLSLSLIICSQINLFNCLTCINFIISFKPESDSQVKIIFLCHVILEYKKIQISLVPHAWRAPSGESAKVVEEHNIAFWESVHLTWVNRYFPTFRIILVQFSLNRKSLRVAVQEMVERSRAFFILCLWVGPKHSPQKGLSTQVCHTGEHQEEMHEEQIQITSPFIILTAF